MNLFEEEFNEMVLLQNNKYVLTNISDLNREVDYNELSRIFNFFNINNTSEYNTNNKIESEEKKQKKNKKKDKIETFLRDSAEKTEVLINFLTNLNKDKSIFTLRNLRDLKINENEKKENETINYLKKIDFLEKSTKIFNTKLSIMKDNKDISQLIFRELINFKKNGFLVEENYKFPESIENISTKLIYKSCLNLENLFGKAQIQNKFTMNLVYEYQNSKNKEDINNRKFELNYDFYEKFNRNYRLDFILSIKLFGKKYNYNFGNILEDWIEIYFFNLIDESLKKYEILNYMKFMFKYIFYKIFKLETHNILKLIKTNFYENKLFTYFINKTSSEITINSSYMDILEVNLSVMKNKSTVDLNYFLKDICELKSIMNPRLNFNTNKNLNFQNNNHSNINQSNKDQFILSSSFSISSKQGNVFHNSNSRNYFQKSQNKEYPINSNQQSVFKSGSFDGNMNNFNKIYGLNNVENSIKMQQKIAIYDKYIDKNNYNNNVNDDQTKSSVTSIDENKGVIEDIICKFDISQDLILNFILNIFIEIKSFKSIREFYYKFFLKNSENTNLSNFSNEEIKFSEFYDATIINFNLNKFNNLLLQKFVICRLEELMNKRFITLNKATSFNYLSGNYLYRFTLLNNLLNSKLRNMEFSIIFQKNRINLETSFSKKNSILVSEKESINELYNKKIDLNLLFRKIEKFLELNQ